MTWTWQRPWRFTSKRGLRAGLEKYTAYLGTDISVHLGERTYGDEDGAAQLLAMRRRAEIDACLAELEYPFFRRLLEAYYCTGLADEKDGWCLAAKRMGLRGEKDSRWDKDTFERQVDLAIDRLWHVHQRRYQQDT